MKNTFNVISNKLGTYEVEEKKLHGKQYLVVPVTMMVEGVHNGSQGAILHPMEELGKIPESFNGIPIMINHPEKDGTPVSANSPEVLEESAVGLVFDTYVDEKKLKANAWFEKARLKEMNPALYKAIQAKKQVEVSLGVFTDFEEKPGIWNEENYIKVAINHRPDHLAILPDATGACSIEDGCGLNNNKLKFTINGEMISKLLNKGFSLRALTINQEEGYKAKMDAVYSAIRSMGNDSNGTYCYLEEMFDDSLIYCKSSNDGTKMYKQSYKFEGGKIELVGEAVEVRRKVEYVVNSCQTKNNGGNNMPNEVSPCLKKKVDELIANSQGHWTEADRDFLQTCSETQLEKLVPRVVEKEKVVNAISDEDKAALATYKAEQKAKRDQMIKDIQTNSSKELWPDAELNGMSDATLKRVLDSVRKPGNSDVHNYSLQAAGNQLVDNAGNEIEPMIPIEVEDVKPEK